MFVVILTYTVGLDRIQELVEEHRSFLKKYYDQSKFICSGPQDPMTGGVILARASSEEELRQILQEDPFWREGAAEYQIIKFTPKFYDEHFSYFVSKDFTS